MSTFDSDFIAGLRQRLDQHPIYGALRTIEDLQVFMQHHVHSVWDFMSLIKFLQHTVAPARWPWVPAVDPEIQRFINELVLEEETDEAAPGMGQVHSSHFMLYIAAMREIGADADRMLGFVEVVAKKGVDAALAMPDLPAPATAFNRTTFAFLASDKPHVVAAALALGREHVIPGMFRAFLQQMRIGESDAPTFHFYLNRHIHLDEDFHAPLSLRLLDALCAGDPVREAEARAAAIAAVDARVSFWDGVMHALPSVLKKAA